MHVEQLRIQNLRCLSSVAIALDPGINVFVGNNGAGKTSVLESIFLLSHARSFRVGSRDALLRLGSSQMSIFAELRRADGVMARIGLGREAGRWQGRLNGAQVSLANLVQECAVVCFDPGSHALISGAAEERRRFLDWGVFHVEHGFLSTLHRYQRALKQRNSLLRSASVADDALFEPWEVELSESGHQIDQHRGNYLRLLADSLVGHTGRLLPELGPFEFRYRRGWSEERQLRELLRETRARDVARGYTSVGAHRADWSLGFAAAPQREHFSRGQEKLVATACLLSQATLYQQTAGEWPVVCLDDLASELDVAHQSAVIDELVSAGAQILVTGTEVPEGLRNKPTRTFHVEQGQVAALL
jgi:DNA replication and repair protein RecF